MTRGKSKNNLQNKQVNAHTPMWRYLFVLALGAMLTAACFVVLQEKSPNSEPETALPLLVFGENNQQLNLNKDHEAGKRSVMELLALPDDELEKVDVLELSMTVAREAKGYEHLDYDHYDEIIDDWANQFLLWLPTIEWKYDEDMERWQNDINYFRLVALCKWIDIAAGAKYVPKYRALYEKGIDSFIYTDLGHLLVFGLIDTREGTCATMPVLHVIMGRRCGWPVSLTCVKHHYMCRYDDGQRVYNVEATDTGRGSFSIPEEDEIIKKTGLSSYAIESDSDLRSLTNREMLAVFIAVRARYYKDTNQMDLADRDYSLARSQFPKWRGLNYMSQAGYFWRAEQIFKPSEYGHPSEMSKSIYNCCPTVRTMAQKQEKQRKQRKSRIATRRQMEIDRRRIEGDIIQGRDPFHSQNSSITPNSQPYNPNPPVLGHSTQQVMPIKPNSNFPRP